jgi:hypothetical protein
MNRITPERRACLPYHISASSSGEAPTDKPIDLDAPTRNQVEVLCSSDDTSKTSKTLADGKIQRHYGTQDDGTAYICESHPGRDSYQRLMIFAENPSEVQSITELLKTESLSVKRNFSRGNSISLNSESIKPLSNSNYPQEKRLYSLDKKGHSILTEQSLFDGLITIKHDAKSQSQEITINNQIYRIALDPESSTPYSIPFPKSDSQGFEITPFEPIDYSTIPDQEISPQIKVKFSDLGEINVHSADDTLLTKYTSQGDRIDYDSEGNINTVIDKEGTLYQFKESQPYNKSKADGVFIAYELNSEEAAKKVFKTGPGRDIAIYNEETGQAVITADTPEP